MSIRTNWFRLDEVRATGWLPVADAPSPGCVLSVTVLSAHVLVA
jgi:hypothetical protein